MDDQDTRATEPAHPDRAADVADSEPREPSDDETASASPVPDPTDGPARADDMPGAD